LPKNTDNIITFFCDVDNSVYWNRLIFAVIPVLAFV